MIACVDVDYRAHEAVAACVLFENWTSIEGVQEVVAHVTDVADYQPGEFFRRELPCLLQVLAQVRQPLAWIVIDGYVWLNAQERPGLGAHLYDALHRQVPVVGVAKTAFRRSAFAVPVVRGASQRPLWVTAAGMDVQEAADGVRQMHGDYRLPALLQRVDRLCRTKG